MTALPIALGVLALSVSAALGYHFGGLSAEAELARIREQSFRDQAAIAEHNSRRLLAAQTLGDTLTNQLAVAKRLAATLRSERDDAIRKNTTGRHCLDAAAVRVLNAPGQQPADLPEAPGQSAATDASAFATDTDVGLWSSHARDEYDECARRLDALIVFEEQRP